MIFTKNTSIEATSVDLEWIERVCHGELLFDWNKEAYKRNVSVSEPSLTQLKKVEFRSEDFRDAIGSAQRMVTEQEKMSYIQDLVATGITMITLDIYSSSEISKLSDGNKSTLKILKWLSSELPDVEPVILARAHADDLEFCKQAHRINNKLIVIILQDLSEVRRLVEGWGEFDEILANLSLKIMQAKRDGLRVMAFTENLSITNPDEVKKYVVEACKAGADWVGIADTAGRLFPTGAAYLTQFVTQCINRFKRESKTKREIGIVFHGHNDFGNAVSNSIAAISEGATVIDVVTNGLGERVGNTDLIKILINYEYGYRMLTNGKKGKSKYDLSRLQSLSETYTRITGNRPGEQQPVVGDRAFSTNFGIHANYYFKVETLASYMREHAYSEEMIKSFYSEAWKVYSAASPADYGRKPDVRTSSYSGRANVIMRLIQLGLIDDVRSIAKTDALVLEILSLAKRGWGELPDGEIMRIWEEMQSD